MIIEQVREVGMLDFITAKSGAFDMTKARASSFRAATYLPVHCRRPHALQFFCTACGLDEDACVTSWWTHVMKR